MVRQSSPRRTLGRRWRPQPRRKITPAEPRGSVYATRSGYGIRWADKGQRKYQSGFTTKTEARRWFTEEVLPRLRRGGPDPSISFDDFCELFLDRHQGSKRTKDTLRERLVASRNQFGAWTLRELEGADDDVAAWRAGLAATSRYRLTLAFRQALNAAMRWRYVAVNPVAEAGPNRQPQREEFVPFSREQIDAIAEELGPVYGPLATFGAETGLRTNELIGLERRDIDLAGKAVTVQRRVSDGLLTPYPKTERSRRRVPLTERALAAYKALPPRLDTPLAFPAPKGGYLSLDNFRTREWYDALDAAGLARRGPYHLRHTFASEALAAGISIFELARVMGTSVKEIDRTYGHLAHDSEDAIRARLEARGVAAPEALERPKNSFQIEPRAR
jgi:integrase